MITFAELRDKWEKMPVFSNAFLLIDGSHHIDINIGYEKVNQKTLLIRNSGSVESLPSSTSISVSNYQLEDGTWVLSFRLIQVENEEVFLRFCWDIIESSREIQQNVIDFILERYSKWLRLLQYKHPEIMSVSRQKGLIGELLFLENLSLSAGKLKALDSWCGPQGADQDFIYDNTWAEVKTVTISSTTVSISSLEQLDTNTDGIIILYKLDKTTDADVKGFSLNNVVNDVRGLFQGDTKMEELLDLRLFQYGYKDRPEYDKQKYRLKGTDVYKVNAEFPRLTKRNVPNEITSAKYFLDLVAISLFKEGSNG